MKNKLATENLEITKREKAHNEIVRNAAVEGMVLLKNNGVLPFDKSIKTVALYGIGARRTVKGGTGSGMSMFAVMWMLKKDLKTQDMKLSQSHILTNTTAL